MKENFLLIFFLSAVILVSGCIKEKQSTNLLTYDNPDFGIRIKYPENWQKPYIEENIITFEPRNASAQDSNIRNFVSFIILVENLSSQLPLDEFMANEIESFKEYNKNNRFNIEESSATTLANNPAHKIVYTVNQSAVTRKSMQILTIKNNKTYIIGYVAVEDTYPKFLSTIEKMVESFEIYT